MKIAALLLLLALFSACHKEPEPAATAALPTSGALRGRLGAANSINSVVDRDDAFLKLAKDAAAAKDIEVTTEAIMGINAVDTKDLAAEACALALSRQAEVAAATKVAQLINATALRDRTLKAIAKGQ